MPSVWQRLADIVGSVGERTGVAGSLANLLDPDNWLPGGRDAAFTLALIALSAKMAVADGVATASESRAFKRTVEIPPVIEQQVDRVFELAKQDVAGYEAYAKKIGRFFAREPDTLEHVEMMSQQVPGQAELGGQHRRSPVGARELLDDRQPHGLSQGGMQRGAPLDLLVHTCDRMDQS